MLGKARRYRREFEREALPCTNALYGTALRLTRNERDAEDLVQDTLLRAYRYWARFTSGTNCKAWLFKILTNTFITRYHAQRRTFEARFASAEDAATDDILSHEITQATRDPEGALASRLLSDDVVRALEALPADFRLAVLLSDVEEFSYKEIAEIMDCPVGTVMSRLFRGRRLLQRTLHDYAVEQGIIKPLPRREEVADLAEYRKRSRLPRVAKLGTEASEAHEPRPPIAPSKPAKPPMPEDT